MAKKLIPAVGELTTAHVLAKEKISHLKVNAPISFLIHLSFAWTFIVFIIFLTQQFHSFWFSLLALFLIAGQQNALAVLMHEQVHHLAFKSRLGDLFVNIFTAYPILITVEGYRKVHMSHHKFFMTEKDPDFSRKSGADWDFPMAPRHILKLILMDLLGLNFIELLKSKDIQNEENIKDTHHLYIRLSYYIIILATAYFTHTLGLILLYWILPLVTIMRISVRFSAVFEHRYNLVNPSITEATPLIKMKWWEHLLYPTLNFIPYHIYHHLYPTVPFSNLPKVHAIYKKEGLVYEEYVYPSLGNYIKSLIKKSTIKQIDTNLT